MAYSTASANAFLKLILQGVAIAGIADNAASAPLTQLYLGLYTDAPGAGANQATNEISYTGYQRVAVPRSASGWVITNDLASLVNAIEYGEMTDGAGGTAKYLGLGTVQAGSGLLLVSGALTTQIPVQVGVVPRLKTSTQVQFVAG